MFDTHCHLNLDVFDSCLVDTINRARDAGVEKFVVPGVDLGSSYKAAKIAEDFEGVYFAAGIHPTADLEKIDKKKALYRLEELASTHPKCVAIGEIGLDYYRFKTGSVTQKCWLEDQIMLARKLDIPIILHNRHATDDFLDILSGYVDTGLSGQAVFHCCSAEEKLLQFAKKHKIYIGVDGDVTYDRQKQEFVKDVPLDLLLLETDSPYLAPEPLKSKKTFPNEPENLNLIAKVTAKIKSTDAGEVMRQTTNNASSLFNTTSNIV